MSVPSIKELKATKQVPHRHLIMRWLEESNFTLRDCKRGSSHVRCTHNEFPDIVFNIVRDTDTLGSLMRFTTALIEIERRHKEALQQQFEQATQDIYGTLEQKIPADLQYRLTEAGNIVLTDRAYPQVGLTFSQKDIRLTENKVRELTMHKREYAIFLHRMRNEYDVTPAHMDNGVFDGRLSHVVYVHLSEETLPLYQENDDPSDAIIRLSGYVEKIMDVDKAHAERKEAALANPAIRQTLITCASRRGERHNHVYYTGGNGRTLEFTFNTFSNQRLNPELNGKTARISVAELEKLERIVGGISALSVQQPKAA